MQVEWVKIRRMGGYCIHIDVFGCMLTFVTGCVFICIDTHMPPRIPPQWQANWPAFFWLVVQSHPVSNHCWRVGKGAAQSVALKKSAIETFQLAKKKQRAASNEELMNSEHGQPLSRSLQKAHKVRKKVSFVGHASNLAVPGLQALGEVAQDSSRRLEGRWDSLNPVHPSGRG